MPARALTAAPLPIALAVALLAGCAPKTPCARLAAAICDDASAADCQAFVAAEMTTRDGALTAEQRNHACQIVLDDAPTTRAFQRAFTERGAQARAAQ